MIKRLICLIISVIIVGCSQSDTAIVVEKELSQKRSDSLTTTVDSIAAQKALAKNFRGMHKHQEKSLAAQAHQDPQKTLQARRYNMVRSEGRRRSRQAATKTVQKFLESKNQSEEALF